MDHARRADYQSAARGATKLKLFQDGHGNELDAEGALAEEK